jgi:hypothetical protein
MARPRPVSKARANAGGEAKEVAGLRSTRIASVALSNVITSTVANI